MDKQALYKSLKRPKQPSELRQKDEGEGRHGQYEIYKAPPKIFDSTKGRWISKFSWF